MSTCGSSCSCAQNKQVGTFAAIVLQYDANAYSSSCSYANDFSHFAIKVPYGQRVRELLFLQKIVFHLSIDVQYYRPNVFHLAIEVEYVEGLDDHLDLHVFGINVLPPPRRQHLHGQAPASTNKQRVGKLELHWKLRAGISGSSNEKHGRCGQASTCHRVATKHTAIANVIAAGTRGTPWSPWSRYKRRCKTP